MRNFELDGLKYQFCYHPKYFGGSFGNPIEVFKASIPFFLLKRNEKLQKYFMIKIYSEITTKYRK